MTETALAVVIAGFIALLGLVLLLFKIERGDGEVRLLEQQVKGSVGLILLLVGLGTGGYVLYHPFNPDKCVFLCPPPPPPPPPPPQPKKFDFPDQDTRAGDGKSGRMTDIHVTLLPPDAQHPLGQLIATWLYTGSGGSQQGTQNVNIHLKGKGNVDLPSPGPLSLDRGGCHYGGIRQTITQTLNTPFDGIDHVELEPGILEGKVGRC